jgi:uncharacterized membrane protein YcjF (UPF0283 family)
MKLEDQVVSLELAKQFGKLKQSQGVTSKVETRLGPGMTVGVFGELKRTASCWRRETLSDMSETRQFDESRFKELQKEAATPLQEDRTVQRVVVTDIQMPFGSMIRFMVKWAIASLPAFLILSLLAVLVWAFLIALIRR